MLKKGYIISFAFAAALICSCGRGPEPYGAVPSPAQVRWQMMERNMFVHFGPNTFSGREWGDGTEPEDMFNPTDLDCRQWARTAKEAGFKGIIITAKHHDGFCLWPNPVSSHTVAQSSWRGGEGDVLRELSDACREYGLKFGVYISPWDRFDPTYGSDEYNDVFVKTLQSALGSYGEVYEQWFDGANGEGPNGKKQVYDWPLFHETVRSLQPDAVMFSDVGPGCRWCGNESGSNGRTSWSTLNTEGFSPGAGSPPTDTLQRGNVHGAEWIPSETDVSIRPGWFWRESENSRVKSVNRLLQIFYESTGRNSLMLLNVPPDTRGHIHEIDSTRLMEFARAYDAIFSVDLAKGSSVEASSSWGRKYNPSNLLSENYDSCWASGKGEMTPSITVTFPERRAFNRVSLQEYIPLGQRIASFSLEVLMEDGTWKEIASETTIGYKRIVLTETVTSSAIRINILKSYAEPVLSRVQVFMDDIYVPEEENISPGVTMKMGDPLTLDLGKLRNVSGFVYGPAHRGEGGVVMEYDLESSLDGAKWTKVISGGEFDNIVNNPTDREVGLPSAIRARYLRLTPIRSNYSSTYGVSTFDVLE